MGEGEPSVVRALSETHGKPFPDNGDVCHACQGEENDDGARGGAYQEFRVALERH